MKLPLSYYLNEDVVSVAHDLIGKELFTNINGQLTSGIISETEAYAGTSDKASHAYSGKPTNRTKTMFMEGGRSYVYLCYGIHHLFNIVTGGKNLPHAVLIRAIIPNSGIDIIKHRRNQNTLTNISNGPGKLSKAMAISTIYNNIDLQGTKIWIEEKKLNGIFEIETTKRIGIDYAEEDALLPYRFVAAKQAI